MKIDLDSYVDAYGDGFEFSNENKLITEAFVRTAAKNLPQGCSILDLGLGRGDAALALSQHASRYVVVEGSAKIISSFKLKPEANSAPLEIIQSCFQEYFSEEKFDRIIMSFVLEHVDSPHDLLKKFIPFLRPHGTIIAAVPNAESLHRRIGFSAGLMKNIFELSESDRALGHKRLFSIESLTRLCRDCGCRAMRTEGLFLKPFTTKQLETLAPTEPVLNAMIDVGRPYPELCAAIMVELEIEP